MTTTWFRSRVRRLLTAAAAAVLLAACLTGTSLLVSPAGAAPGHFNQNPYTTGCMNTMSTVSSKAVSGGTMYIRYSSACGTNWVSYSGAKQTTVKRGKDSKTNRWTQWESDNATSSWSMMSYAPGTTSYVGQMQIGSTTYTATCSNGCSWKTSTTTTTPPSTTPPGRNGWAYPIRPHATLTTYSGHGLADDIAVPNGTPIYAMGAGKAYTSSVTVSRSWCPSWAPINGKQLEVKISTSVSGVTHTLTYAHLSRFAVSNGQSVAKGQLIGYVGKSGCATDYHVHIGGSRSAPRTLLGTTRY